MKVTSRDYYDVAPPIAHAAGDIWSGLPAHGFVGSSTISGIVITPACDLSNRKVETITYLPIIPIRCYFATPAFLPEIQRELNGQLQVANLVGLVTCPDRYVPPRAADLEAALSELATVSATSRGNKEKTAIDRALAGIQLLRHASNASLSPSSTVLMRKLFGDKAYAKLASGLVTNSNSVDTHFLPADEQPSAWAGVVVPSLALFRYAFSAPLAIFDRAQDRQEANWTVAVTEMSQLYLGALSFASERPLKRSCLRPRFLADLLTRYVAMHVRLGSPDFSQETVNTFVEALSTDT